MSDQEAENAPTGELNDSSYIPASSSAKDDSGAKIVSDDADIEDPKQGDQDSDAQLESDENAAIDKDNIIDERTRGAKPEGPGYSEGPDEDDIPSQ